ncbi:MAG: FAD-dependent oxidoreductase [Candidatus Omnitrophica bacterium]|nr:FAD-dependent oxidoreductase [Candidatus Omnitrophota bacterium]
MKQLVVIGNSAAGISAVEAIRKVDKTSKIIVISDEDYPSYYRCLISYYLAGQVREEKLLYRSESFYKENNIELRLNRKVMRVEPKRNRIILEDKSQLSYDSLLIATGASPKFPHLAGIKKRNVFGFRTIKDVKEIEKILPVAKNACILGGGLIGLKAAYALKKRNIEVKLIVKSKQVLSQMLDYKAAGFVQKKIEENGIELIFGQDAVEIIGDGELKAIKLDSGKVIGCSLVIVAKGVSPNTDLVKDTPINVREGIIANEFLQTNIPNIYTAGDVCEGFDLVLNAPSVNALWPIAVEQGRVAGQNMTGQGLKYQGSLGMNSLEFFGLAVVSLGIFKIKEDDPNFEEIKFLDEKQNIYKKLILKDNYLVGAVLVGDIRNSGVFLRLIRERINISSLKDKLLNENFGYPEIMDLVNQKENLYV